MIMLGFVPYPNLPGWIVFSIRNLNAESAQEAKNSSHRLIENKTKAKAKHSTDKNGENELRYGDQLNTITNNQIKYESNDGA